MLNERVRGILKLVLLILTAILADKEVVPVPDIANDAIEIGAILTGALSKRIPRQILHNER